jgi:hypothetical protein
MVSYRQSLHAQLPGPGYELGNTAQAIEQAVLSMDMKMCEHDVLYRKKS